MHPGSLSQQWNVCGNPICKCKDYENPKKHGPYYSLSFAQRGKSTTRFIKAEFVDQIEQQIENYKVFKALMNEWKAVATDLAKMRMDDQKKIK